MVLACAHEKGEAKKKREENRKPTVTNITNPLSNQFISFWFSMVIDVKVDMIGGTHFLSSDRPL